MNNIELNSSFIEELWNETTSDSIVLKLTHNASIPIPVRNNFALIMNDIEAEVPVGFQLGISFKPSKIKNVINLNSDLSYLSEGDIVKINIKYKKIRVLYRTKSKFNFFLLTERCNHYCLMCSQPPRNVQDDWHYDDVMRSLDLIDRGATFLGFTGGEPTLLGERLIDILRKMNSRLPETSALVLTNGRRFSEPNFTKRVAEVRHQNLTLAIPLYSDSPHIHDYVVQSEGAFEETIRGILLLKERNQKVQIRMVVHKQTYARLPQFAEFIYRNLAFVDHIALMGLEITGFTKANLKDLWIDPIDYASQLETAASYLDRMGMNVSIFNHQLCTIPRSIWHLNVKSISDWKNSYEPVCGSCEVKEKCGGFFTTSNGKISRGIAAKIS
jgi:His-Xaa-Ser system radical SAM maturase HxsC